MVERSDDRHRSIIALSVAVALAICSMIGGITLYVLLLGDLNSFKERFLIDHFIAIFGLPGAAAASFIIVTLFRQGEEPIRIKGLGFEIQGAAGPVVLWVLCFLAICGGIKLLW